MPTEDWSEEEIAWILVEYLASGHENPSQLSPGINNRVIGRAVRAELNDVLPREPCLRKALDKVKPPNAPRDPEKQAKVVAQLHKQLRRTLTRYPDLHDALHALLPRPDQSGAADTGGQRPRRYSRLRSNADRTLAALVLAAVVAAVALADSRLSTFEIGSLSAIEAFVTAVAAFLPGWLFVRFLAYRAGPLWNEYVLNLYRLGIDEPRHLPRPPESSLYYARWREAGGWVRERSPTIYQQKFDAYYGKNVSRSSDDGDAVVRYETLFPVLLFTAVTAAGWVMIFRSDIAYAGTDPASLAELLGFAFLGAYLFNLQMLVRRSSRATSRRARTQGRSCGSSRR